MSITEQSSLLCTLGLQHVFSELFSCYNVSSTYVLRRCFNTGALNSAVEPQFNQPLFNEVLETMNYTLWQSQSYSTMYAWNRTSV